MSATKHTPGSARAAVKFFTMLAIIIGMAALGACSAKKNTAGNRKYQEFITRYNIYYNGDVHYKETLADMEGKYEDDYSRLVFMHPVEAKTDQAAPQPTGDFNRSIEKAQKAIQLRSIKKKPAKKAGKSKDPAYQEWMKRDEYNPFLHNAWMMMARSQYYNGDFLGAASTFFYISKHFTWLPKTVVEAKLMQALCYIDLGWQFEAEVIITRIKTDELTTNNLRRLYNFVWADYYLHAENYEEALPFLEASVKSASGAQKTRLNFLLGQVYARLDRKEDAYKAFKAAGSASSASYRTKFNARIKQSEVYTGADIESEVKALRRMTRYDRNKDYLDQVYYAIGNLYLHRGDTLKAIENYELANEKSTRNGIDKAINQLQLGELYFLQGNYEKAQPNYAEAVPLLSTTYPNYEALKLRSDVLDELALYSQNVNLQDSLLRLAAMSPEERDKVIAKIIADLIEKEKKEAEEARREEFLAEQAANGNQLQDNTSQSFTINSDNSWYFYNTATKNAGKTEFQKRWGSRKLEDDWRRRNKATFNTDDFDAPSGEDDENAAEGEGAEGKETDGSDKDGKTPAADDPHQPEYYLAQIPSTEEEIKTSNDIIQEGLYNMGVILKDKLEDFDASSTEFDRLLKDYPDNIYRLDTYYNRYLMEMRRGRDSDAEHWRQLILAEFPESPYGIAMADPEYLDKLRNMDRVQQELYQQTYDAYLDGDHSGVHRAYTTMSEDYPLSKIMPKFMFLEALTQATEHNTDGFNATLRELLERYPDTDITPIAAAWLKGMAQGRDLSQGASNVRSMIWDTRLTNDSIAAEGGLAPAEFTLDEDVPQVLIFTFATDEVSSPLLLYQIARHNFRAFVVKDFDLEPMNFGRLGMIVVRGFANMDELNNYRRVMATSEDFKLLPGVRPIAMSEANFKILIDEGRSFDEYFRYLEEQNYVDAQAGLIPTEDIETLQEAEEAAADAIVEEISTPAPATAEEKPAAEEKPIAEDKPSVEEKPVRTPPVAPAPATPDNSATPTPAAAVTPVLPPAPNTTPTPAGANTVNNKPTPVPMLPPGSEGDDDDLLND